MRISKRIIDWINLLLGGWLIVSPWVLGTVGGTTSTVLVIMGIALVIFSAWALFRVEERAAEWWNFFMGVLLFLLPWIFNYTTTFSIAWNSWIVGVVVAILALVAMPLVSGLHHHEPPHHA